MKLSAFGQKFSTNSGILQLMDDLGNALAGPGDSIMMGGGNPAHIEELELLIKKRLFDILENPEDLRRMIGIYDPPQGEKEFILHLKNLLNSSYGWGLEEGNIALTNGSQSAFFLLFNMFAGLDEDKRKKKILLPLAPEYIGYADVGLEEDFFSAVKPNIEFLEKPFFKYRVDFNELELSEDIAAICVSRPTNPTGNVLLDEEILALDKMAKKASIPLIIDSAYGTPFPDIIFNEAKPIWNENIVLSMSLSKLGLPAARTGIVIAEKEVISALSKINAIMNLATGSFGAMLTMDLFKTGQILDLSRNIIKPYYKRRADQAVELLKKALKGFDFYIHKPEGAIFLWLWFPGLPVSSEELYQRLKKEGVIVVPGHYFFPGIKDEKWAHQYECIRLTYAQEADKVKRGVDTIGRVIKEIYAEA